MRRYRHNTVEAYSMIHGTGRGLLIGFVKTCRITHGHVSDINERRQRPTSTTSSSSSSSSSSVMLAARRLYTVVNAS